MLKTWSQFDRKVLIDKPIDFIYPLWTTSTGITSWFLSTAIYTSTGGATRNLSSTCQAGDQYRWEWHNWDGHATGDVLIQNGSDHLRFEFEGSLVDLRLSTFEDGRTLVSLTQSSIREDEEYKMRVYCGCGAGWTFWLTNLKAYCEHGILLNESGQALVGKFDGYQLVNT